MTSQGSRTLSALQALAKNELVLGQIAASLSASELLAMFSEAAVDEPHVLDRPAFVDSILKGGDNDKLLILAKYMGGGRGLRGGVSGDSILELAKVSKVHRCALLANERIDWYGECAFHNGVKDELLVPVLAAGDETTQAAVGNPRMARDLVAKAIRGHGPFANLGLERRVGIALKSLEPDYIDSPNYPGKDSPESNEMYFLDPNKAFLVLLRELFASADEHAWISSSAFGALSHKSVTIASGRHNRFAYSADDWLSIEDKDRCGAVKDWRARFALQDKLAVRQLLRWSISIGASEPLAPSAEKPPFNWDMKGSLAAFLAYKSLLADHNRLKYDEPLPSGSDGARMNPDNLLLNEISSSDGWIGKAGNIAASFDIAINSEVNPQKRIARAVAIVRGASSEPLISMRGLALSPLFWGLRESSYEVGAQFRELGQTSTESSTMYSHLMEWYGDSWFRGETDQIVERAKPQEEYLVQSATTEEGNLAIAVTTGVRGLESKLASLQLKVSWTLFTVVAIALYLVFR